MPAEGNFPAYQGHVSNNNLGGSYGGKRRKMPMFLLTGGLRQKGKLTKTDTVNRRHALKIPNSAPHLANGGPNQRARKPIFESGNPAHSRSMTCSPEILRPRLSPSLPFSGLRA
jgi:hypothetical protein